MKGLIAGLGLAVAMPLAASAVTVEMGDFSPPGAYTLVGNGPQGNFQIEITDQTPPTSFSGMWTFDNGDTRPLKVTLAATESGNFRDLVFELDGAPVPVVATDPTFELTNFGQMFILGVGEDFNLELAFSGGATDSDFDFRIATAAVPVPAAGWLFVSALGGLGLLARRRASA